MAARRGGCSAAFDDLNKYFTISNMPVVSSNYWNMIYGLPPGEAMQDLEGRETMRNLARSMVFLMKSIELGKRSLVCPKKNPATLQISFADPSDRNGFPSLSFSYAIRFLSGRFSNRPFGHRKSPRHPPFWKVETGTESACLFKPSSERAVFRKNAGCFLG